MTVTWRPGMVHGWQGWWIVRGPLEIGLVPEVGRFGPTIAAPSAIQQDDFSDEDLLSAGTAIVVMLAWVAAMFAAAVALLNTRDVT